MSRHMPGVCVAILLLSCLHGLCQDEPAKLIGHMTATYRALFTATAVAGGIQQQITMEFTEVHEAELTRDDADDPWFGITALPWRSTLDVKGSGLFSDGDITVRWNCTPVQPTEALCELNTEIEGGEWRWAAKLGDFSSSYETPAISRSAPPDMMQYAEMWIPEPLPPISLTQCAYGMLYGDPGAGLDEQQNPLIYRFTVPRNLKTRTVFNATKTRSFAPAEEVVGISNVIVQYTVAIDPPVDEQPPPQVRLVDIPHDWWPEDDSSVTGMIVVSGGKRAQGFRFTLYDVSSEPGTCCNSESESADPDLSFEPGEQWSIEEDEGSWTATSGQEGQSATIQVMCHDWGAWGKLRGEALIEGRWQPASVPGSPDGFVSVPHDSEDDHIADSWQEQMCVVGLPATDDSDSCGVYRHASDGDGLSIYEEYRGLCVLRADSPLLAEDRPLRLHPWYQDVFVLDMSGAFAPELLEQCTGLRVHGMDETMCVPRGGVFAPRLANYRSGHARRGSKLCLVVGVDNQLADAGALGDTTSPNHGLRDVQQCKIQPGAIDNGLLLLFTEVTMALADPACAVAREFAAAEITPEMLQAAEPLLRDVAKRAQLATALKRWAALREACRAFGAPLHAPDESASRACAMQFPLTWEELRIPVLRHLAYSWEAGPQDLVTLCGPESLDCQAHLVASDH